MIYMIECIYDDPMWATVVQMINIFWGKTFELLVSDAVARNRFVFGVRRGI